MNTRLSSLNVTSDLDVSGYVRGMAEKIAADKAGAESSKLIGAALAQLDAATTNNATGVTNLSRRFIDGYSSGAQFEKAIRDVDRSMRTGMGMDRAQVLVQGLYTKFGLLADATKLAQTGFVSVAPVVDSLNTKYKAMADAEAKATLEAQKHTAALAEQARQIEMSRRIADYKTEAGAEKYQTGINQRFGIKPEIEAGSQARESAFTFLEQARREEEARIAREAREAQALQARLNAQAYQASINSRTGVASAAAPTAPNPNDPRFQERSFPGLERLLADEIRAEKEASKARDDAAASLRRMKAEFDPLGEAVLQHTDRLERYKTALAAGTITAHEFEQAQRYSQATLEQTSRSIKGMNVHVDKNTQGYGLARHEMINFSRQMQDIGVSLSSGQSFATVAIQQGTQIFDIFSSSEATVGGFFRQAGAGALRFATSLAGVTTGAVALGAAAYYAGEKFDDSQRGIERGLSGIGRASGATLDTINRVASASADSAKVSIASAREIATAFASTGKIAPDLLGGLVGTSSNFAKQTGQTQEAAAAELAKAFSDPLRGADALNEKLGFLDARTRGLIRTLVQQNDTYAAQRVLQEGVNGAVGGAVERTSGLARAWIAVKNAVSDAYDAIGSNVSDRQTDMERYVELGKQRRTQQLGRIIYGGPRRPGQREATSAADEQAYLGETMRRRGAAGSNLSDYVTAQQKSLVVQRIAEAYDPNFAELDKLKKEIKEIDDLLKAKHGPFFIDNLDQTNETLERLKNSFNSTLTPLQKLTLSTQNNVASTMARTLAERQAADVDRERIAISGQKLTTMERELTLLQRAIDLQAQANREAQDANRTARDANELANLRPYQRAQREAEFRDRDRRERLNSNGVPAVSGSVTQGTPAFDGPTTGAQIARGLVGSFDTQLKALMAAVPGVSVGSGFRTYDEQARLYAQKPGWAAKPGSSQHEFGLAADLKFANDNVRAEAHRRASEFGLSFPMKDRPVRPEPWHVEPIGGRSMRGLANIGTANSANASTRGLEADTVNKEFIGNAYVKIQDDLKNLNEQLDVNASTFMRSAAETARASKEQEILNDFYRQGIPLTTDVRAQIGQLADGYGDLAKRSESLRNMQDTLLGIRDAGKEAFSGFFQDILAGKSAADALKSSLDRLASRLLNMATDRLFDALFGGKTQSGGGILGNLIGSVVGGVTGGGGLGFATPTVRAANGNAFHNGNVIPFARGGILDGPMMFPMRNGAGLAGESGPEGVLPLRRNGLGQLGVMATGGGGGRDVKVDFKVINNTGAQVSQKRKDGPQGPAIEVQIDAAVANALSSGPKTTETLRTLRRTGTR